MSKNFMTVPGRPMTHYGHIVYDGQYVDRQGRICNVMHVSQTSYMYINMNRLEREIHAQHGRPPINERPEPIQELDDGRCWKRDSSGKVHVIRVPKNKETKHVDQIRATNNSRGTHGKKR